MRDKTKEGRPGCKDRVNHDPLKTGLEAWRVEGALSRYRGIQTHSCALRDDPGNLRSNWRQIVRSQLS